jgi:hypothetical protein
MWAILLIKSNGELVDGKNINTSPTQYLPVLSSTNIYIQEEQNIPHTEWGINIP